jgi:hypothetical protein
VYICSCPGFFWNNQAFSGIMDTVVMLKTISNLPPRGG